MYLYNLQRAYGLRTLCRRISCSVHCVVLCSGHVPFPSKGEASPHPNTMVFKAHPWDLPLVLPNGSLKKQAPNAAPKLPNVRLRESQNTKAPAFAFLWCAPCWRLGSADRNIFAKVPGKFCNEAGESQWPVSLCPEKGFRDASCMFTRLSRSDRW